MANVELVYDHYVLIVTVDNDDLEEDELIELAVSNAALDWGSGVRNYDQASVI
jgi:hypothetical protein